MSLPLALLLGLAFGLMAWWRCFYSVLQFRQVRREGSGLGRASLRVLLSSGPWVVLGVAALAPYVLTQAHGPEVSRWGAPFFGAFAAAALPALMLAGLGARRESRMAPHPGGRLSAPAHPSARSTARCRRAAAAAPAVSASGGASR